MSPVLHDPRRLTTALALVSASLLAACPGDEPQGDHASNMLVMNLAEPLADNVSYKAFLSSYTDRAPTFPGSLDATARCQGASVRVAYDPKKDVLTFEYDTGGKGFAEYNRKITFDKAVLSETRGAAPSRLEDDRDRSNNTTTTTVVGASTRLAVLGKPGTPVEGKLTIETLRAIEAQGLSFYWEPRTLRGWRLRVHLPSDAERAAMAEYTEQRKPLQRERDYYASLESRAAIARRRVEYDGPQKAREAAAALELYEKRVAAAQARAATLDAQSAATHRWVSLDCPPSTSAKATPRSGRRAR